MIEQLLYLLISTKPIINNFHLKLFKLAIYLLEHHYVTFQDEENLQDVANRAKNCITILIAWFQENMKNPMASTIIGRLYIVQSLGEKYYLRTLLSYVKALCKDVLYQANVQLQDLNNANDILATIEHKALTQLENILLLSEKSLKNFSNMPISSITSNINNNKKELSHLICEERSYNAIYLY
ncbi:21785_t:CDS:2 [Dentiscutata erythropus]|uniref:21785_t:CDS:1 n=1 Tax=Dentiscutata erythropus TaxID=1348616 RepID=A0A9N9HGW3_9GLOM|nr:21785_t:CDS:2 [Dentiscutata erythropus]